MFSLRQFFHNKKITPLKFLTRQARKSRRSRTPMEVRSANSGLHCSDQRPTTKNRRLSPASMPAMPDSLRNSPALKLLTRTPKSFKCLQDKATGQLTWESKGPTPHCHISYQEVVCREDDSLQKDSMSISNFDSSLAMCFNFGIFWRLFRNNGTRNSRSRRVICFLLLSPQNLS